MAKPQVIKKATDERFKQWLERDSWMTTISGLIGIVSSLLGVLLSLYVSPLRPTSRLISLSSSLVYFVGGIILLGLVIVVIGGFLRRKNHEVIVLRRRISEIYLLALRKSALNPQPHATSNE